MIVYIQNNAAGSVEVEKNVTHVRAFAGNKVEVVYERTRPWLTKATTYNNATILTVKEEEKIMKKINKATARKLYKEGKSFWVTACNMRPECGLYMQPSWIQSGFGGDFDRMINNFTYYNCNHECGYYPAFYVEEEV